MLHVYYFYLHINLCSPAINGCHCPVSSARRTLVYPAVGRRFKPWSDQQPGPLKSGKIMLNNLIFQPDFTIFQCIWSCLTFPCFPAKHSAVLKEQLAVYLKQLRARCKQPVQIKLLYYYYYYYYSGTF